MEFSTKQKNELLTGVILAQELEPIIEDTRRFITIRSFRKDKSGELSLWNKTIPSHDMLNEAVFNLAVYSVRLEDMEYDLDESMLPEYRLIKGIDSFEKLYSELAQYMGDVSGLLPHWHCDNPLE